MWLLLLSLVSSAGPNFTLSVTSQQGPAELLRRARIRCGGPTEPAAIDGGIKGTFTCINFSSLDVTDELRAAEFVVVGKITKVETPPAASLGDPAPQWKRAALKVERVLKGAPTQSTSFLFIGSTKNENAFAPKVKVGQRGVWLLTRGGAMRELTMLSAIDFHAADAADYLSELIAEARCPGAPEGSCAQEGTVCPGDGTRCTCAAACQGGADVGRFAPRPLHWLCNPTSCSTAVAGTKCAPDGLACEGCWGTHPFTCADGGWVFHDIPPPP